MGFAAQLRSSTALSSPGGQAKPQGPASARGEARAARPGCRRKFPRPEAAQPPHRRRGDPRGGGPVPAPAGVDGLYDALRGQATQTAKGPGKEGGGARGAGPARRRGGSRRGHADGNRAFPGRGSEAAKGAAGVSPAAAPAPPPRRPPPPRAPRVPRPPISAGSTPRMRNGRTGRKPGGKESVSESDFLVLD